MKMPHCPILFALSLANAACTSAPPHADDPPSMRLSGTVRAVNNDCYVDGVCTVTVGTVMITTMSGRRLGPAPIWGQSDGQPALGQKVDAYCRRVQAHSCTLEGDPHYFLRHAK